MRQVNSTWKFSKPVLDQASQVSHIELAGVTWVLTQNPSYFFFRARLASSYTSLRPWRKLNDRIENSFKSPIRRLFQTSPILNGSLLAESIPTTLFLLHFTIRAGRSHFSECRCSPHHNRYPRKINV